MDEHGERRAPLLQIVDDPVLLAWSDGCRPRPTSRDSRRLVDFLAPRLAKRKRSPMGECSHRKTPCHAYPCGCFAFPESLGRVIVVREWGSPLQERDDKIREGWRTVSPSNLVRSPRLGLCPTQEVPKARTHYVLYPICYSHVNLVASFPIADRLRCFLVVVRSSLSSPLPYLRQRTSTSKILRLLCPPPRSTRAPGWSCTAARTLVWSGYALAMRSCCLCCWCCRYSIGLLVAIFLVLLLALLRPFSFS